MEQRHLGRTGLRVSRIGLGTLTWGRDTDEHDAADLLKTFWEAGGSLVDTADVYGDGEAEYLLGRLIEGLVLGGPSDEGLPASLIDRWVGQVVDCGLLPATPSELGCDGRQLHGWLG